MKGFITSLLSIFAGLAVSLIVVKFLGESPWEVLKVLGHSAFGNVDNILATLNYATPLIFTGLSVLVAFHVGLFNIGAEGQLYIGSLFMTFTALKFSHLSSTAGFLICVFMALLGGGLWASIAGYLKAKRGSHEVIVTIMLNFISYALCSYVILNVVRNPNSQNPESAELPANYFLSHLNFLNQGAPSSLNSSFLISLFSIFTVWFLLFKTNWGLEVRLVGSQIETARRSGVPVTKRIVQAMFLSGSLAGLVAVSEILGNTHKYKDQFSPGYGFFGIAVALLARNKPINVLFSAILFGALAKGALDLELDTEKITRDMAVMIQGLMILFIASQPYWLKLGGKIRADR